MKIAYVLSQDKGGLPHYAAQLANAVSKHAEVVVFKSAETSADDMFSADVQTVNAFEPTDISLPDFYRFEVPIWRNLKGLYSYRNVGAIDRFDPDLIHDPTDLFPHVKLFSKLSGLDKQYPFVVTYHEVDDQHVAMERPIGSIESLVDAVIPDLRVDQLIVHAENQVPSIERSFPGTPVDVVPHGTNDQFAEYDFERHPVKENSLLFFGNVIPEKGIDTLIKAIPLIRNKIPDINLVIAGDGRLSRESRRIVDHYSDHFEIHDYFVPNERVGEFFTRAALVVLPYRDRAGGERGHSGVLSTAYSFGKPVVATDVGDFPRLVEDAGCGLVVPTEDPHALADAIIELLGADERRRRMGGQSARQGTSLSWDAVAEVHIELYERVLAKPRPRPTTV